MMTPQMNGTVFLVSLFTPILVAVMRRESWSKDLVQLVAYCVVICLYVLCRFLDNALVLPLTAEFYAGLLMCLGGQKLAYDYLISRQALNKLEAIGNKPAPPPPPIPLQIDEL